MRRKPWNLADIDSFADTCRDADRLNSAFYPAALMSNPHLKSSSFEDISDARKEIERHVVYKWLAHVAPRLLKMASTRSPPTPAGGTREFEYLLMLTEHLRRATRRPSRSARIGRPTQRRDAAHEAIKRVLPFIKDGTVNLDQTRKEVLINLLLFAKADTRIFRTKATKYPQLDAFAVAIYREYAIADVQVILEFAAIAGIDCPAGTARHVVDRAVRAASRS